VVLQGRSSKATAIAEVMTANVITGKPSDLVDAAMSLMSEKRIRHLPIVDGDQVLGILSLGDLVKETITYQQNLIKQLENYIRG
jgi:signal-transduction protein with cAMP-binding, CBS, and nucleotidyltransferase domain